MLKLTVLLPIGVPSGTYCWDGENLCQHFDNHGGHPVCTLGIGSLKHEETGRVPKPVKCLELMEASNGKTSS